MKIQLTHPLISCICVTDNRPDFLLKAIICFDSQSYPNREMIISYPQTDVHTKPLVDQIQQLTEINIICIERENGLSIGKAKNDAISKSNGEYTCIWDDDDWYDQKRLIHQYNSMKMKNQFREACLLKNILLFDGIKQKAYLSFQYLWAGSLLCKKEILISHPFADSNVAEDYETLKYLESRGLTHYISDSPHLYLFAYHGYNSTDYYHFAYLARKSQLLEKEDRNWIRNLLYSKIAILNN